jgi:hypothetical protein
MGSNMKMKYILILILASLTTLPSWSYEAGKQQKLDVVNSYQPTQFEGKGGLSKVQAQELLDLKFQTTQTRDLFIESMPLNTSSSNNSPISKNDYPVYDSKSKSGFGTSENIGNLNETEFWNMDNSAPLEGNVLLDEKPKKKLFTRQGWNKACKVIKGEPTYDALILGMQSVHTSAERKIRNNTNNMLALQYGGISAGYFYNSWYKDTYFLAVARRMWRKQLKNDWSVDFQYKAGIMHGYGEHAPLRLGWVEPVIIPVVGLNYKTSGLDFTIIPSGAPVFAVSCRVGLPDPITYKSVHAKYVSKHPPKPQVVPVDNYNEIKDPGAIKPLNNL